MTNKKNFQLLDEAIEIGNRIKSTRMLSGYTRKSFALETGISSATLRFWEEPKHGRYGLTKKGAERLITAFNKCGVLCDKEWLLSGKGHGPKLINTNFSKLFEDDDQQESWGEEEAIIKDIESFKENNPNSIILMITDTSMLPIYSEGDYVGGSKKYSCDIKNLIGLNCIVETDKYILARKIVAGRSSDVFSLIALNKKGGSEQVTLNVELKSAAEIVFHRWKGRAKN